MRYNLNVMHIEKNVMDNILGTLLNLKDQTKDNYKARLDLADMIRSELHLQRKSDNKYYFFLFDDKYSYINFI